MAALALLLPSKTPASTWYLTPDGPMTIQGAVDAAGAAGDTILLGPGTYTGPGNRGVNIPLRQLVITSSAGAAATIIDCEQSTWAFQLSLLPAGTTEISNLTIRNATDKPAIRISDGDPGSALLIRNNCFENNHSPVPYGGAVLINGVDCTIEGNVFSGNHCRDYGGALFVKSCEVTIQDNEFVGNDAVFWDEYYQQSFGNGGAISMTACQGLIADNLFQQNEAGNRGGAIASGGNTISVLRNTFDRNRTTYDDYWMGLAGAFYISGGAVTADQNLYVNNETIAKGGGAIWVGPGDHAITNSTFVGNRAEEAGSAIHVGSGAAPVIESCVFAFNDAWNESVPWVIECDGAAQISCCLFFGNTKHTWYLADTVDPGCGGAVTDTVTADPLFCDADAGDYRIYQESPCAEANSMCGVQIGAFAPQCGSTAVLFQDIHTEVWAFAAKIGWQMVTDEEITSLRVYRSDGDGDRQVLRTRIDDVTTTEFVDEDVVPGGEYTYTVAAVRGDGSEVRSLPVHVRIPSAALSLQQNYPNPFTTATTVRFVLDAERHVDLAVYDVAGRRVATLVHDRLPAGEHAVLWSGPATSEPLSSGIYFCRLEAGPRVLSRKMIHIR